jgi:hypothetical protein
MELFLIGPLKSSILQPSVSGKLAFHKGCKIEDFNGSVFLLSLNAIFADININQCCNTPYEKAILADEKDVGNSVLQG